MAKIAELLAERKAVLEKAQAITNTIASKDGSDIPSAAVEKEFTEHIDRINAIDADVSRMKAMQDNGAKLKALAAHGNAADNEGGQPGPDGTKAGKIGDPFGRDLDAETLGDFYVKSGGLKAVQEQIGGMFNVAAPSTFNLYKRGRSTAMKAATDAQATTGLTYPEYDTNVVMLPRLQPTVADLLGSGSITATALQYWIQVAKEGGPTAVAELGQKPFAHYTWTTKTDVLKKLAGLTKISDESFADIPYIVSEINGQLLYDLAMVEEQQLLSGDGTGPNLEGLLNRSGVGTLTKLVGDSVADTIFKAMTVVQNTQFFAPDGIVIHPTTYQDLRLAKDANGQYYGGGFFGPAYNNGDGLNWQPPVWGLKTVVTPAVPVDQVLVGNFKQAATVYRKGGVSIDSTNSNVDDFEYNRVTVRVEERLLLQSKRPGAVIKVDLTP